MAYTPPHKRHLKGANTSKPVSDYLVPEFQKNVNLRSGSTSQRGKDKNSSRGPKIVHARTCISKWWTVGSTDDNLIPGSFHLECIPCDLVERERGEKPLVLVDKRQRESNQDTDSSKCDPRAFICEKVQPDLLTALHNMKIELDSVAEEFKPYFVARFGKIFFHGRSTSIDIIRNAAIDGDAFGNKVGKSFHNHVPIAFVEEVKHLTVPKIGFLFESEKERYHVKIFDKSRPDSTISCKCTVSHDGKRLEMHKIESNLVRHLVEDISCLYKDLDLRLMLYTKRVKMNLEDEANDAIDRLIKAAVVDPDVKGGLRWTLGEDSAGERFNVIGAWHMKYMAFKSPSMSMRLYFKHADRFDFRTSEGHVSDEVTLKLTSISRWFMEGGVDEGPVIQMLHEAVKLAWDHFLDYKNKKI